MTVASSQSAEIKKKEKNGGLLKKKKKQLKIFLASLLCRYFFGWWSINIFPKYQCNDLCRADAVYQLMQVSMINR